MSTSTGTAQPKSARPISISPDGTEDYVRGLPDITVGSWQMEYTYEDVEYMDGADAELIPDIPPAAPSDLGKISISALCE